MEKLKAKVASSSSRVIASLQQAATGTFQPAPQMGVPGLASQAQPAQFPQQQQQQQQQTEPGLVPQQQQQLPTGAQLPSTSAAQSRLMAADAAAHLTEKEREILLQVFRKEEQFQRDTIK